MTTVPTSVATSVSTSVPTSVVVEADGGSRGNPGKAAYGALIKDATTGALIAERAERIGVATNNVAEYRGLIAGLELYAEYADGAELEVRMDSKLVVEQMSGRWKIKHPDMRPLAARATSLAPFGTTYTWIPRALNAHADRLANLALDGPEGIVVGGPAGPGREPTGSAADPPGNDGGLDPSSKGDQAAVPDARWLMGPPTRLILIRHGETDDTVARLFSGSSGRDPGLNDLGREHAGQTATWLSSLARSEDQDVVMLASPMRRTRETAAIVAEALGVGFETDDGLLEAAFGAWEGRTYADVSEQDPEAFRRWFGNTDARAGGTGDSLVGMATRMAATRERLLRVHRTRTLVLLSHLTPIRMLVDSALGLPLSTGFHLEISPASVTELAWFPDGRGMVRLLNGGPRTLA